MRKIAGILFLMCLTLNVQAQLLWKISGNGLQQPSYLFGTHHLVSLSILDSIKGFQEAFKETTRVVGELSMPETQTPQAMQMMQKMMVMPGDTTLNMLFSPEEYRLVNAYVKENLHFDMDQTPTLKPAFISNNIVVMLYIKHHPEFNPEEQMDSHFQQRGLQEGKKIAGLESMEFQCNLLFNGATMQRQADLLLCSLTNVEKMVDMLYKIATAYQKQDLDELLKLSEEKEGTKCDPLPGEMEAMTDNRNITWVKKLPAFLKETSNFIAVGALHLPGKNGLINLLRKEGFLVDPVE